MLRIAEEGGGDGLLTTSADIARLQPTQPNSRCRGDAEYPARVRLRDQRRGDVDAPQLSRLDRQPDEKPRTCRRYDRRRRTVRHIPVPDPSRRDKTGETPGGCGSQQRPRHAKQVPVLGATHCADPASYLRTIVAFYAAQRIAECQLERHD